MRTSVRQAFTLIELVLVITISASMMSVVSLFLVRSVSTFRVSDEQSRLNRRIEFAVDHMRRTVRHSISPLHCFQNEPLFPSQRAFERTETLFFLTDMNQDTMRELHFFWFDRMDPVNNAAGTDCLLHVWKEASAMPAAFRLLFMPPDMMSPSFLPLLAYLRNPANFNGGGPSTVTEGWSTLLDGSASTPAGGRAVYVPHWRPPPWLGGPPPGFAFNVDRVVAGTPPNFIYAVNPILNPINGLLLAYPPSLPPPQLVGFSYNCQLYIDLFSDSNGNLAADDLEARVRLVTTLNMLLIPSAGCVGLGCP